MAAFWYRRPLLLSRVQAESLLDPDALRDAVAQAMADVSAGQVSMPARIAAVVPDTGLLAAMPAYLPGSGGLAVKLVSLFPGNTDLPTHQAVIVVFDPGTGAPVALVDGTAITVARTAAASALSAALLARPGRGDARHPRQRRTGPGPRAGPGPGPADPDAIRLAGRDPARAEALAESLRSTLDGVDRRPSRRPMRTPAADADIVCATTHSPTPVVARASACGPGTHVISVGYNTAGREVDSATVVDSLVVVESRAAVLGAPPAGANELRVPIEEGLIGPDHIHAELGELVAGTRPGRTSPTRSRSTSRSGSRPRTWPRSASCSPPPAPPASAPTSTSEPKVPLLIAPG